MNFQELIINYKRRSRRFRLILVLLGGLILPLLYGWVNLDISAIESGREESQVKKERADHTLKKLIEQKKNAPRLEEQLKFTEGELASAKKRLPDEYFLDQMIQKIGLSARNAKVTLKLFTPGQESVVGGEVQYVEMPIAISLVGTYSGIAQFADSIVHYDTMLNLRNMDLKSVRQEKERSKSQSGFASTNKQEDLDLASRFDEEVKSKRVEASMELVLFRSLKNGEQLPGSKGPETAMSGSTNGKQPPAIASKPADSPVPSEPVKPRPPPLPPKPGELPSPDAPSIYPGEFK
jgi:Tfp pilus assembly protein PilO